MKKFSQAFTLAEVLITLSVIGIVSALVIPSVLKNYNDKKYNTARLKALKTFGEAGKMASINGEINGQENARAFVENVLSKYLKIVKICDNSHPTDCGFPTSIKPSDPSSNKISSTNLVKWNQIGYWNKTNIGAPTNDATMSIIVSTNDGFSAKIFYNPKCGRTNHDVTFENPCNYKECNVYNVDTACMNVIYDMNGLNGPNKTGEDIGFVTVFWSGLNTTSAAPGIVPYSVNSIVVFRNYADSLAYCDNQSTKRIPYTLPSIDELSSLYINNKFTHLPNHTTYSSTPVVDRSGFMWTSDDNSNRHHANKNGAGGIRSWCVRR